MNQIRKLLRCLKDPFYLCQGLLKKISPFIKDDVTYVSLRYYFCTHKKLNLKNPNSFNEKLQWLKLYGHKPEYAMMADKLSVKDYVKKRIGDKYVVPCLAVWNTPNDIDINQLPNQFVLKCTHDSNGRIGVCKDKSTFNIEAVKASLNKSFKKGYYWAGRDKQYRDIERKVIADKYLDDGREGELQDYKFWCFNGVPKVMYVTNKGAKVYENFYDMDFNPIMIDHGFERRKPEYKKPMEFEEMKQLATILSEGIPFVRVDFFDVHGKVYFGEFTFFDWGGFQPFGGDWDERIGSWLNLPI